MPSVRVLIVAVTFVVAGAVAAVTYKPQDDAPERPAVSEQQARQNAGQNYIAQVNRAQSQFAAGASKLELDDPSSAREFQRSLTELDGLLAAAVADLDGIEAPAAVMVEHGRLIGVLADYRQVIKTNKDRLLATDRRKVGRAAQKIADASKTFTRRFDATIGQINRKLV